MDRIRMSRWDRPKPCLTIVKRPIGEAPEWVRDAWIGLQLPLARRGQRTWWTHGVLTGQKGWLAITWALVTGELESTSGYAVSAATAVELLSKNNGRAAKWWRQNAATRITKGKLFIFDAAACRLDE